MNRYNFKVVEKKWQKFWDKNKTFKTKIDKNISGVILDHIYSVDWSAKLVNNWIMNIAFSSSESSYIDRFYDDYFSNNFY